MIDPSLTILQQLFSSATSDASAAMCRWTNGQVTLTLECVRELPLEEVTSELAVPEGLQTMVVLTLDGDLGGHLVIAFDDAKGRHLAASLLGRDFVADADWTELEQSALKETGNILACAYMNALTRLIDVDLVPSPPHFVQDYGASVLQQALMAQAMACDRALICATRFQFNGENLDWNVFFLPTQELRTAMEASIEQPC